MSRRHPAVLLAAAITGVLALGGCGVFGDAQPADTPTAVSTGSVSPTLSTTAGATASATVSPSPAATVKPAGFTFPVKARTSFGRTHHDYPATDIFAACGSKVVAPTDGTINYVSLKDTWDPKVNGGASRGGLSWSLVTADGLRFYGSHLRKIDSDIKVGVTVHKGDVLGEVGKTGDAAYVACHLHFGISPACGDADWWTRRGAVSPYPFLKAWQAGQNLSPLKTVKAWKKSHGCSTTPPKDLADA